MAENANKKPDIKDLHALYVKGLEDELENRIKHMIEFEKIAIQTSITLNSAFLFAAPTIAVAISKERASQIFLYPMVLFIIGIVSILLSLQLIRVTMQKAVENSKYLANLWTSKIIQTASGAPQVVDQELIKDFVRSEEKAKEAESDAMRSSKYAEWLGWLSYSSMLVGVLIFAQKTATIAAN
jgi:hypothetical protein